MGPTYIPKHPLIDDMWPILANEIQGLVERRRLYVANPGGYTVIGRMGLEPHKLEPSDGQPIQGDARARNDIDYMWPIVAGVQSSAKRAWDLVHRYKDYKARNDIDYMWPIMAYEGIWNGIDYMWPILTGVRAWDLISRNLHRIYQSEVYTEDGELEISTGYTSQSQVCTEDAELGDAHERREYSIGRASRSQYTTEKRKAWSSIRSKHFICMGRNPQAAQTTCEKEGGPSRVQRQRREDEGGRGEGPKSGYPDQRFEAGIPASLLQPNVPRMFVESSLPSDSTAHHRHG
ncbi:hypothetical protein FGLOB1_9699 [Fusarium globosum]|uniref:Uncharacterized protein n=1 Tax=Fusarium globosum TaxID=78864 RepID=A0A8H6D3S1_9HYPO|nr:hypothetical protein FGLOB1_9699 [Fusarium globosum]